jgi:MFS family permease
VTTGRRSTIAPDTRGIKLWPFFWLTPDVTRANAVVLLFSSFSIIGLLQMMGHLQPMVLHEILHVPQGEQGSLVGNLGSMQEVITILLAGFLGALSDKLGRRVIYVVGVAVLAFGYLIYPLAGSIPELVAYRIVYAVGMSAATVMLHTCIAEYSQNATRGKWMGVVAFVNGVGTVVVALVLAKMPSWFTAAGYSAIDAVRFSMWLVAAYFVFLALLIRFGLQGRSGFERRDAQGTLALLADGLREARANRRIALSYGMAFAARGDLAVLISFFSLWVVQTGTDLGLPTARSTGLAGFYFGIAQLVALIWGVVMGFIFDRLERMTGMCLAFALAAIGYFALSQVTDPFGGGYRWAAFVLVGIGEACAMIAGGVLVGQEAPARVRGAVMGTFSLVGAAGMLTILFAGGRVFDAVGRTAPFLMMALINAAVFIAAVAVRAADKRAAGPASQTAP